MRIERDHLMSEVTIVIRDEDTVRAGSILEAKRASELIAALAILIQKHGDLPVFAADHSGVESAWFREAEFNTNYPPDCIMIG